MSNRNGPSSAGTRKKWIWLCHSDCFSRNVSWGWSKTISWTNHSCAFPFHIFPWSRRHAYFCTSPDWNMSFMRAGMSVLFPAIPLALRTYLAHNKCSVNICWVRTTRKKFHSILLTFKEGSWCYIRIHLWKRQTFDLQEDSLLRKKKPLET